MADVEYIGKGNPDGFNVGRSDDKIGFFGLTTPIAKPSLALTATAATTANTGTTVMTALSVDFHAIKAVLVNLGLVTSA
jgi:hypothetical protein